MDVRLGLRDVADLQLPAGGRHDLHDADRAHLALGVLIELGFLVPLGRHEQEVHVVPVAVLPEELDDRLELLALGLGGGVLRVLGVDEVLPLDLIPEGRSQPVLPHERVQGRDQLRAVLADGDGELAAGADGDVLVDRDVREDLLPEFREVVVDTMAGIRPAFTISSRSSSSRLCGAA